MNHNEQAMSPFTFEHSQGDLSRGEAIINAALDERDAALNLVREVLERFEKLNTLMKRSSPVVGDGFEPLVYDLINSISPYGECFDVYEDKVMKKIDARYWLSVMDASRLNAVMNADKKQELRDKVQKDTPKFEPDIVFGTLSHYMENRVQTFVEGAIEVFKSLDCSFKSNDQIRFRERVIFSNALGPYGWNHYSSGQDRVGDLERIFAVLDGKDPGEMALDQQATRVIGKAKDEGQEEVILPYFRARVFKNGNIHLYFTRKDLVDQLNSMIANHYGHALGQRTSVR